ncbi:MAG: hypothetical protein HOV79_00070 [Hamadaea sp.]|nr:hypothetical protein [Hamadaea sp.]
MPNSRKHLHWWALGLAAAVTLACSAPSANDASDDAGEDSSGGGYLESLPTFDPVEHSGEGDSVIPLDGITQAMLTASHDGEHYFSIAGLDDGNEPTLDLPVNAIGAYEGTTVIGMNEDGTTSLQITADGAWTITLAPLASAPALPEGGTGDGVFTYEGDAATWAVKHEGEHYFSLFEYTGESFDMGMLATEIGAYDGEVPAEAGPAVVVVQADGAWTITPK